MNHFSCLWVRRLQLALCLLLALWWTGPTLSATHSSPSEVVVQEGDMASVLAFRLKPRGATIEQMMVALLQRNPEAFIQGNVNLLRDGAVLRLPPTEDVLRTPADEARDTVQRHHRNFLGDLEKSASQTMSTAAADAQPMGPASTPQPADLTTDQAADRQVLLERLRIAKTHLNELEQNIRELERLTQQARPAEPAATASGPDNTPSVLPNSWIWLGVAAIVAVMVGVGSARSKPQPVASDHPPDHAAVEFQARLDALDLNLDAPPPSCASLPDQPR